MNRYDDHMTERAVKALLRRATTFGYSTMQPNSGSSERTGSIITLRNRNGTLASYKVRKRKATGEEYIRFLD